jgi:hypothetical protein
MGHPVTRGGGGRHTSSSISMWARLAQRLHIVNTL